jgi:phage terminase large subunit-like protein
MEVKTKKITDVNWSDYVDRKTARLLLGIPGYDPFAEAGGCWFDYEAAGLALDFFPVHLRHIKGKIAGEAFVLEDWQQSIIVNLFGWKREDNSRRYREGFIYVPKKNGKTPMAGGLVLFGLLCDGEMGAEIYSAAGDRQQAGLVFGWVKGMVRASKSLDRRCKIYQHSIVAVDPATKTETGSFYKPVSAEAGTKHGYNSHMVVIDELHVQPNRELVDCLETSTAARLQPLIISITTADFAGESICNEKYDYACKVRDGIIKDPEFLPVIYEATRDDDWTDPKVWRKANPNFGVSVDAGYIASKCKKAQEDPAFENTFKRLHLNIQTEQEVRWIPMEKWDACGDVIEFKKAKRYDCYGAMDLSSVGDLTCYGRLFILKDGRVAWFPKFYIPKEKAHKRELKDRVPFLKWAREGHVILTPGSVVDYSYIKADFESDYKKLKFCELAFDRWNFEALRQQFIADGMPDDVGVAFGQGYASMSAPAKRLMELILSGKLIHNNNPVMRWMAANVTVDMDPAGNIKPSKSHSSDRIDGMVALIMAVGRSMVTPGSKKSIYESRGAVWL